MEKAEILESVVEFLKTEKADMGHRAMKRVLPREQRPNCSRQHNYHEGMRSCLLRVSHFIASKSQELEETGGDTVQTSFTFPESQMLPPSPGHIHKSLLYVPDDSALSPQRLSHHHHQLSHPYHLTQKTGIHCDTSQLLSPTAVSTHITDPVWRPWPQ